MSAVWTDRDTFTGTIAADIGEADLLVANCLAAAIDGDTDAYYDLGVAFGRPETPA